MPYQENIPAANDQISVSQGAIQGNFQAIDAGFNQNHTDLNSGVGLAGQHTFVQLSPQAPVPAFAGAPGFWASTAAGNPILLHTAAGVDVNLTANHFLANGFGWSYLPSGILMKFGRARTNGAGFLNFNFPGPAFTQTPFVMASAEEVQPGNIPAFVLLQNWTNLALQVNTRSELNLDIQAYFQWFAIGI